METVYKREKKYNDEAGGRLSGDMDDTKENGDKVMNKESKENRDKAMNKEAKELVYVENFYDCWDVGVEEID